MKANPYEPGTAASHLRRWPVRRYVASTVICIFAAGVIAAPGLFLLIEKWNAARMGVGIYDAEFAGQQISISVVIAWSLGLSVPLWLTSFAFVFLAWRNYRQNRQAVAE